ncbi:MAG: nucleotidyltransferase family protein [Pseudomonadota bacterium]|nr:nucleotidyltransferase family protein [Pseudomonadota bacterium]
MADKTMGVPMKAMILAAGLGKRLRPFTHHTPKCLLHIGGEPLLGRLIKQLASAGVNQIMINVAHLGHQVRQYVGCGSRWGVEISISQEPPHQPLEAGGAVKQVLDWFEQQPFLLISSDIYAAFDFKKLTTQQLSDKVWAHMCLVPLDASLNAKGFELSKNGVLKLASSQGGKRYDYAGVGVFHPRLWKGVPAGVVPFSAIYQPALEQARITASVYHGLWANVGDADQVRAISREVCEA